LLVIVSSEDRRIDHYMHTASRWIVDDLVAHGIGTLVIGKQANTWGSILPAVWSFMLAARERGLGTVWTTLSPLCDREVAELLGIPHEEIMQAALIPVAYTSGTDFRRGPRVPLEEVVHWNRW
jgi:nitroreductase